MLSLYYYYYYSNIICLFIGKKRGATLRIGNVTINAPSILKHEEELEPLATAIPAEPADRKK
jgi:chromodomain-helicase-DNA-binding protein 1